MNFSEMLETMTDLMAKVKRGGADPALTKLDSGILEVAFMISALDGAVLPAEVAAFDRLAQDCRGYDPSKRKSLLDSAARKAGYLMALEAMGLFTPEERVAAFVSEALKALPAGFASGDLVDVRRAFVMWVGMGVSDGYFSGIERAAIEALRVRFAEIKLSKNLENAAAWTAAYPGYGSINALLDTHEVLDTVCLLEENFIAQAETLVKALDDSAHSEWARKELEALINAPQLTAKAP